MGFALIWHIWWMAIVGLIGVAVAALVHAWRVSLEVEISAEAIEAFADAQRRGGATA